MAKDANHSTAKSIDAPRMDPDKLKNLWGTNTFCRSRSIEGLNDAARGDFEGVTTRRSSSSQGKQGSAAVSKASDPLHKTPWLGVDDRLSNLTIELDDRKHGGASRKGGCGVRMPFPHPSPSEGGVGKGTIRGEQLFGHSPGRRTLLSGVSAYDDSNDVAFAGVDCAHSGISEEELGIEVGKSFDRAEPGEGQDHRRVGPTPAGPVNDPRSLSSVDANTSRSQSLQLSAPCRNSTDDTRGRAVMLPLIGWKDWSADHLHWTYPAVVHAFPACLLRGKGAENLGRGGAESGDADVVEMTLPSSTLPSPFKPHSLGEVFVRTAPDKDLAPAGVGAGPWRRRWLLLQQTYVFELLQPPPAMTEVSRSSEEVRSSDGGGSKEAREGGVMSFDCFGCGGENEVGQRDESGGEGHVAPVGFLCLSQASVEKGGLDWGPRTLLLRCLAQPPDISREEASSKSVGRAVGNAQSSCPTSSCAYGGVGVDEIRVELRVPSEEVGARWTELFRSRAALKMSTIFEPTAPDFEMQHHLEDEDVETNETDRENGGDVYDRDVEGRDEVAKAQLETDASFSVLGTGRFSKVVWAKRRSPWGLRADGKESNNGLYAVKVVDKQAFWSRVRSGTERADALAREVFCQTVLTWHAPDTGDNYEMTSEREGRDSEERSDGTVHHSRDGGCGGGIVRLHSVLETATELVLEMDLMSRTDLFDRLEQRGTFSEPEAAGMVYNLLVVIDNCNTHGFCHRDVKLSNILYPTPAWAHGPECVVLADFGMASRAGCDGLVRGRCGTSGYVAPEILKAKKHEGYGVNIDVFSAGVVLYMCLCGYEPFYGVDEDELLAANKAAVVKFHLPEWGNVSQGARDLLSKMLESDPSKRITPRDALRHPWVASHRRCAPSLPCP